MTIPICNICKKEIKPGEIKYNGKYIKSCMSCYRSYNKRYRTTTSGKINSRRTNIKQKFGLSLLQVTIKFRLQDGKCSICRNELPSKFVIDHNHKTGQVRDLLCYCCNSALGLLKENERVVLNLRDYIKKWGDNGKVKCRIEHDGTEHHLRAPSFTLHGIHRRNISNHSDEHDRYIHC